MGDIYVLDTTAILTFTDQEKGAEEVERILTEARSGRYRLEACAISLMELYYIAMRQSGENQATHMVALIKSWPLNWVYPDEKLLLQAGRLKASFRLSVADALIAAVAKLHEAILVHKDPKFEAMAGYIRLISLPYKK